MNKRYYFLIRYLPAHTDNELLAGRCISQMHFFIFDNNQAMNKVGISFPDWSTASVGESIAFIGDEKDLITGLSFQPYFSLMVKEGIFELSSVLEVPERVTEARFTRNQNIEKNFLGSKRRRIKRSIARGELSDITKTLPTSKEERVLEPFHRVPISSVSSGKEFILFIQKEIADKRYSTNFNTYGLATNQDRRGTVPDLIFNPFLK